MKVMLNEMDELNKQGVISVTNISFHNDLVNDGRKYFSRQTKKQTLQPLQRLLKHQPKIAACAARD